MKEVKTYLSKFKKKFQNHSYSSNYCKIKQEQIKKKVKTRLEYIHIKSQDLL